MKETKTYQEDTHCGNIYITIGDSFFQAKYRKSGGCLSMQVFYLMELAKLYIVHYPANWREKLIDKLDGHKCVDKTKLSCAEAVVKGLREYEVTDCDHKKEVK